MVFVSKSGGDVLCKGTKTREKATKVKCKLNLLKSVSLQEKKNINTFLIESKMRILTPLSFLYF